MTHSRKSLATLLLLVIVSGTVFAGSGNRTGTAGASELLIPVGTREIGMGGGAIATASGIDGLFWNPASVAKMTNAVGVYVSHMNYLADIGVNYGAVSANLEGIGFLSLSVKSLTVGEIPVTTTQNPDGTGQNFSPQYFTVGLTYSRKLSDRVAVGLTANLITERLGDVSASGIGFNVGVAYDNLADINGLSIGVVVKNVGPQMRFDGPGLLYVASVAGQNRPPQYYSVQSASFEIPSSIEFGLGYTVPITNANSILFSGGYTSNNFSSDEYKLGMEYAYQDLFFVRAGYDASQTTATDREFIFGPAFGAGFHTAAGSLDVTFDYAFRSAKLFDNTHTFSVKLGF